MGGDITGDVLEILDYASGLAAYTQAAYSASTSIADSALAGVLAVGAIDPADTGTIAAYSSQGPTNDDRLAPDLVGAVGPVEHGHPQRLLGHERIGTGGRRRRRPAPLGRAGGRSGLARRPGPTPGRRPGRGRPRSAVRRRRVPVAGTAHGRRRAGRDAVPAGARRRCACSTPGPPRRPGHPSRRGARGRRHRRSAAGGHRPAGCHGRRGQPHGGRARPCRRSSRRCPHSARRWAATRT